MIANLERIGALVTEFGMQPLLVEPRTPTCDGSLHRSFGVQGLPTAGFRLVQPDDAAHECVVQDDTDADNTASHACAPAARPRTSGLRICLPSSESGRTRDRTSSASLSGVHPLQQYSLDHTGALAGPNGETVDASGTSISCRHETYAFDRGDR